MKTRDQRLLCSSRLLSLLGLVCLLSLLLQAISGEAAVNLSKRRDEFPGRRQGGGTHWLSPTATSESC
ncbi:hypothetical protein [Pseudanabaena sp. FACHB-2040]|uniref:hypothetical protein n=1 Tax=Pseudanabaena sp. FACHB-2040 TaxID=2692859 RepID=UPI001683652B|nr:hypothetical protein [Pseudanabaena sp. FACHB-2040]MBD2256238.1 hypothetical protein [Pseudanabaena sp. FACHB-2040]